MNYKDYFTMGVIGFLFAAILLIVSIILYFKFDIGYIVRLFIKKLKIMVFIVIMASVIFGKNLYSMEETEVDYYYITEADYDITITGKANIGDVENGNSLKVEYIREDYREEFDVFSIPEDLQFIMYEDGIFEIRGIGLEDSDYKEGEYIVYKSIWEQGEERVEELLRAVVIRDENPVECFEVNCKENLYIDGKTFYMGNNGPIRFGMSYTEEESGIDIDKTKILINEVEIPFKILNDEIIFELNTENDMVKSGYNKVLLKVIDKAGHLTEEEIGIIYDFYKPICEFRFPENNIIDNETIYFTGDGMTYDFYVYVGDNIGVGGLELIKDGVLLKSFTVDEISEQEWIPVSLDLNEFVTEISILCYDFSNNITENSFDLIRDITGPVIPDGAVRVEDAKGIVGINKRFLAYFTGDDTVVVSIPTVFDDKSGVDSLIFIYSDGEKDMSIRARYDEKEDTYFAVCNIPRNSNRIFRVLARDKLGNITYFSDDVNVFNDSSLPEISVIAYGDFRKEGESYYYGSLDFLRINIKEEVGLNSVKIYINGKEYIFDNEIVGQDYALIKDKTYDIATDLFSTDETIVEVVSLGLCGGLERKIFKFFRDNTPPTMGEIYFDKRCATDIGKLGIFSGENVTVSFSCIDYDDSGIEKGGKLDVRCLLVPISESKKTDVPVKYWDGKYEFTVETGFFGYAEIFISDEFGNECRHNTPVMYVESEKDFTDNTAISFGKGGDTVSGNNVILPFSVISGFSGIKSVKYKIESPNDRNGNVSGEIKLTDTVVKNGLVIKGNASIPVNTNSNDIKVTVILTDNVGKTMEKSNVLNIDKTEPKMEIRFSDGKPGRYFNTDRVVQVLITERNFHRNNLDFAITLDGEPIAANPDFRVIKDLENPDYDTHIGEFLLDKEGDYKVTASFRDTAGNTCTPVEFDFTIDKTAPACQVSLDKEINEYGFVNHAIKAKISILEENFSENLIVVTGKNITNRTGFSQVENHYESYISFDNPGECSFEVVGSDMAGNRFSNVLIDKFIIDLIKPSILIQDLINYKSYNNDLKFEISIFDNNLDTESSYINMTSKSNGGCPIYILDKGDGKISLKVDNIPVKKEYDGIYTIEIFGKDYGGNCVSENYSFSVNRFGSVFYVVNDTGKVGNKYLKTISNVGIKEVNYDEINPEDTRVFLFKNGQTRALSYERDYSVTAEREGFLNSVIYDIDKDNFKEDGLYALSIYSFDGAGNNNQSVRNEGLVSFVVDRTPPRVYELSEESYGAFEGKRNIKIRAFDNMKLDKVIASDANGTVEIKAEGEDYYVFDTDSVSGGVNIVVTDAAGNVSEIVTDNLSKPDKEGEFFTKNLDYILLLLISCECIILYLWINIYQKKKRKFCLLRLLQGEEKY